MIIKRSRLLLFLLYAAILSSLFIVKAKVNNMALQLKSVDALISKRQDEIKLLEAEIAYLSSAGRLKIIAAENNNLIFADISKMVNDPAAGLNGTAEKFAIKRSQDRKQIAKIRADSAAAKVKWRYKNSKNSDIRNVSVSKEAGHD